MKNVVFILTRVSMWNLYEELYEWFDKDEKFNPIVFLAGEPISHIRQVYTDEYYEKFGKSETEITHDFIKLQALAVNKGLRYVIGYNYKTKEKVEINSLNPAILFYHDPYEYYYMFEDWTLTATSKNYKTVYIHYGILLVNLIQDLYKNSAWQSAWRVILETDQHVEEVKKQLGYLPEKYLPLGYPRFDQYLKKSKNNIQSILNKFNNSVHKKVIVFAPHWTVSPFKNRVHGKYGNFLDNYEYILKIIKNYSDIFWVFRPHPLLKAQLEFNIGIEKAEYIYSLFDNLINCELYEDEDIIDVFRQSDGIVLDSLSFLAEYMPTEKPIIFLNKPEENLFNSIGDIVMKGVYKIENIDSLEQTIFNVIINANNDYLLAKRKAIVDNLLIKDKESSASYKIYSYVKGNIE